MSCGTFATIGQCCGGCVAHQYNLFPDLYFPVETISFVTERTVTSTRTLVQVIHRSSEDDEETVVATPSDETTSPEETATRTDTKKATGRWQWTYPTDTTVANGEESPAEGGVTFTRTTTQVTVTVHEDRKLALRLDLSSQHAFGETIPGGDDTIVSAHLRLETREYRRAGFPSSEAYTQTVQATVYGLATGDVMPEDETEFDTLKAEPSLNSELVEHEVSTPQYVDVTDWLPVSDTSVGVILLDETADDSGIEITQIKLAIARAENPGAGDWHSSSDSTYDWHDDWEWVEDGKVRYKKPFGYDNEIILSSILPDNFWRSTSHSFTLRLIDPPDDSVVVEQVFSTSLVDTGETDPNWGFPIWKKTIQSSGSWGDLIHAESTQTHGSYTPVPAGDYGISYRKEVAELIGGSWREEDSITMGYSQVPLWLDSPGPSKVVAEMEFTADNQRFRTAEFTGLKNGASNQTCPSHCQLIPPHTVLQWKVDNLTIFDNEVTGWEEANHSNCFFEIKATQPATITAEALFIQGTYNNAYDYRNDAIARGPTNGAVLTKGAMEQHGVITGVNCQGQTILLREFIVDDAAGDVGFAVVPNGSSIPRFPAGSNIGGPGFNDGAVMYTLYPPNNRPLWQHPDDTEHSYGYGPSTVGLGEAYGFTFQTMEVDQAGFNIIGDVELRVQPQEFSLYPSATLPDVSTFNQNALEIVFDGLLYNGTVGNGLLFELNSARDGWRLAGQLELGFHGETFTPTELSEIGSLLSLGDSGDVWFFKDAAGDHFTIDAAGTVASVDSDVFEPDRFGGVFEVELDFKYLQSSEFPENGPFDINGDLDEEAMDCVQGFWDLLPEHSGSYGPAEIPEEVPTPAWVAPDEIEDHRNSGFGYRVYELPFLVNDPKQEVCDPNDPEDFGDYMESTQVGTWTTESRAYFTDFTTHKETITIQHDVDGDYTRETSLGIGTGTFNVMAPVVSHEISGQLYRGSGPVQMRTKTVDVSLKMRKKIPAATWDSLRAPGLAQFVFGEDDVMAFNEDVFVLDDFVVETTATGLVFTPSDPPNPSPKTENGYTFAEFYRNGTVGSWTFRTLIDVCAKHRIDSLLNIQLALSGRLAEEPAS